MNDRKHYLPRCSICGILHQPCELEIATQVVTAHRMKKPGHRNVHWTPIRTNKQSGEKQS